MVCQQKIVQWMVILGGLLASLSPRDARGEDWPMYQHDAARSGITAEKLHSPLVPCWAFKARHAPEPAWGDPKARPLEEILELRRNHFDDVFQVAVAQGSVVFGSSVENKLYCLDAASGKIRWAWTTGGPIRLAPTIAGGRVYVGSDDGFAYCLELKDGALRWQFRAAPEDRRVLGHGRLISLWPLRAGVLVDGDVAYLAAGIFPAEGVFLYALDAQTGKELWRNDSGGESPQSTISPQGYLLASPTTLYAPMGRISPAAYDRATGKLKQQTYFGKQIGGTYALLAGEHVYTGTEELVAYGEKRDRFAAYPGHKIVVTPQAAYLAGEKQLSALDQAAYPAASRALGSLRTRLAALRLTLPVAAKRTDAQRRELDALAEQIKAAEKATAAAVKWRVPCECRESLILAGDTLVAGGDGQVVAIDAASGKTVWETKVEGAAKGLAVAGGRVLVSTDKGRIYCFGPEGSPQNGTVAEPTVVDPFADSPWAPLFKATAETIVQETGIRRGYCLVLGCETGQLALELARRTDLRIYAVSPDAKKVAAARRALDAAGVYGARVCVDLFPLNKVPYADYAANLIVSETALIGGTLPDPAETARMLKPLGGTAWLGQPSQLAGEKADRVQPASDVLRRWLERTGMPDGQLVSNRGTWAKLVRGAIPGAGSWTHLYGNPGNTACGDDQALRCPLGVLWFGQPGPAAMVNRHQRAAGPLSMDGRLFIQGENVVMAHDAYNGVRLWEQPIPGALRENASHDGSNLAMNRDGVFVAVRDQCLRLAPATGEILAKYVMPPASAKAVDVPTAKTASKAKVVADRWGFIACSDGLLFGTRAAQGTAGDTLFALDIATGKPRWVYSGSRIPHNAIAIDGGRVFLLDSAVTPQQVQAALAAQGEPAKAVEAAPAGSQAAAAAGFKSADAARPDVRMVVSLDAQTGKRLWQVPVDLRHCGGANLSAMVHDGVVILFGVYLDGHYWRQFFAGEFSSRRVTALSAADGKLLWSKPVGYRVRPLVIGDTLHAEPWAFDLKTGEPRMRPHPITGNAERWQFARPGHHCGLPIGTVHCLLFRSLCLGYYDLAGDGGTMHFGAQRPGCWINFIPAGGLLLVPEASVGCMCAFPNMCSVALAPVKQNKANAYVSAPGAATPVQRLALRLGAAGDRKDAAGQWWLGFPRPMGSLVMPLRLSTTFLPGGGYVQRSSAYSPVGGTEEAWLFASAAQGISRCDIPLLGKNDGTALYRVRLGFADPDHDQPGRRVFDVKLQGQTVLKDFDIVRATGGRNRAVVKEFTVEVQDALHIQLVTKVAPPAKAKPAVETLPILQNVEVARQRVVSLGCAVPDVLLNVAQPKQAGRIELTNLRDAACEGTLRFDVPAGLALTPKEHKVVLAAGARLSLPMEVAVAEGPAPLAIGKHVLGVRLVRADGTEELRRSCTVEYLGRRARVVLKPIEDSYVAKRYPTLNKGPVEELAVDGGNAAMGDDDLSIGYLKFRWTLPGRPLSASLRLHNAGNPSGDGGRICLAEGDWSETALTFANRPRTGKQLGKLGPSAEHEVVQCPIPADVLRGSELSLVIDPTSCDGVDYLSRESQHPPELVVEFE